MSWCRCPDMPVQAIGGPGLLPNKAPRYTIVEDFCRHHRCNLGWCADKRSLCCFIKLSSLYEFGSNPCVYCRQSGLFPTGSLHDPTLRSENKLNRTCCSKSEAQTVEIAERSVSSESQNKPPVLLRHAPQNIFLMEVQLTVMGL